ncbi:TlpA disulfide reductase family protein [Sulfurovum sp. XTW-4]|uniref:TlpA disulfide reductase family protein n=1 Tax=Sulfurovum xiamenensis TaxID=3019066 RepID=A0ABT7QT88_9BACT|nr:TlpA disulfide reductase family protein [Sulfurovum xiamenensis]MDM5264303.1 TlpA disulfide reductase family protein [Sulfurovum xiamenensis]
MHKKTAALLSLLLLLLILLIVFIVREEKQPKSTPLPTENTTEVIAKKDKTLQKGVLPQVKSSVPKIPSKVFTLINTKVQSHKVAISDQQVVFQDAKQPIVMVNLFATWCPPCIGEIPYLNDLQKKYKEELFVVGILTHDTITQDALGSFMAKNQINYFISNGTENDTFADHLATTLDLPKNFPIPLTVIYVKGEYFTHYEGAVPVEMIEYDIQQAKKQLEARE